MNFRVLGAAGSEGLGHRPSAFLVNDRTLVDGGTVPGALTIPEQVAVEHALVSHTHLDHVVGLAFLADLLACRDVTRPVIVSSLESVVDALRTSVFNNLVWPDFARIPVGSPVVTYRTLAEGVEQRVGDLWVTPVAVNHTVPTAGFIIHDGISGLVYSGDTGPTRVLWEAAHDVGRLQAIALECTFPNRLEALADVSRHLTPARLEQELDKLQQDVPVWIYHIKPQFHEEITEELSRVDSKRIVVLEQDKTYVI